MPTAHPVTALLLAAGQGSRMGSPKAVVEIEGRTLTERAIDVLLQGGCANVLVVLGADAQRVRTRLETRRAAWGDRVATAECANWASGVSESLRTGLATLAARGRRCPPATLIHLVDLPDIRADVITRVLAQGLEDGPHQALARAAYRGKPGHPALVGLTHWQGVMDTAVGDRGAGPYMRRHDATLIDCDDLSRGGDVDTPADLAAYLNQERA